MFIRAIYSEFAVKLPAINIDSLRQLICLSLESHLSGKRIMLFLVSNSFKFFEDTYDFKHT